MSWEIALRARLLADADVLGLVGKHPADRAPSIDWTVRREGAPLPALVLQTITDARPMTHDGFDGTWPSRVQISVLAEDRATVIALREAAIAALAPAGWSCEVWFEAARVDLIRDEGGKTEPGFVHRDTIDFILWHS